MAHSGATHTLANRWLDALARGIAFTLPTELYVALIRQDGTEVAAGDYARVQLDPSESNWLGTGGENSGASAGEGEAGSAEYVEVVNGVQIDFGQASSNWSSSDNPVDHFDLFDNAGNWLCRGNLTDAKVINNGDPVYFESGELFLRFPIVNPAEASTLITVGADCVRDSFIRGCDPLPRGDDA
ncbi:MAG: hypothetical protein U5P41_07150 [Gammaproteobacteria bacterium]|nr:hypothetical protein [Gammaproteobacteria bacterium]